ncbi:MAG: sensor histidine kinase [bacterium]|nr:MAG: sensor histidine kinase [bacterium]
MEVNPERNKDMLAKVTEKFDRTRTKLEKGYAQLKGEVSRLKKELELKETIITAFFENLPEGVILSGQDGRIIRRNGKVINLGSNVNMASAKTVGSLMGRRLAKKIKNAEDKKTFKEEIRTKHGSICNVTAVPLAPDGRLILLEDASGQIRELSERTDRMQLIGTITAQVAHEIRNPLSTMEILSTMLSRRIKNDAESSRMLDNIRTGLKNIERCVSNYLMFGALPKPRCAPFQLYDLIDEITDFIRPLADASGIMVSMQVPNSIELHGDGQLMKQVFYNLAVNSVQAMPGGGKLSIAATERNDMVTINFSDSGSGIKKGDAGMVFDPFFTTKKNGTGLGLSIAHNIITAHGGKISVDSAPGKGSSFKIEIKGG